MTNYTFYYCDGNAAASRGGDVDHHSVFDMQFENDRDAFRFAVAYQNGFADWNEYLEEFKPEEGYDDEEYTLRKLATKKVLEDELSNVDFGDGSGFIYGIKKDGELIYEIAFDEIEEDRKAMEEGDNYITVEYESCWSPDPDGSFDSEAEEMKAYNIERTHCGSINRYGCHTVVIEGFLNDMREFAENTQDDELNEALEYEGY